MYHRTKNQKKLMTHSELRDGWMAGWMDGQTDGRTDGRTDRQTVIGSSIGWGSNILKNDIGQMLLIVA